MRSRAGSRVGYRGRRRCSRRGRGARRALRRRRRGWRWPRGRSPARRRAPSPSPPSAVLPTSTRNPCAGGVAGRVRQAFLQEAVEADSRRGVERGIRGARRSGARSGAPVRRRWLVDGAGDDVVDAADGRDPGATGRARSCGSRRVRSAARRGSSSPRALPASVAGTMLSSRIAASATYCAGPSWRSALTRRRLRSACAVARAEAPMARRRRSLFWVAIAPALGDLLAEHCLLPGDGAAAGADDAEEQDAGEEEDAGDEEPAHPPGVGEVAAEVGRDLVELGDRDDPARPDLAERRVDVEERHAGSGAGDRRPRAPRWRSCR